MTLLKWYLSSWHYKAHGCKKPYNPIIGETFSCVVDTAESRVSYVAEQCSHHPPVSAFYLENQKKQYCANGYVWTKSQFTGNSAMSSMVGRIDIHLPKFGEQVGGKGTLVAATLTPLLTNSIQPSFPPLLVLDCLSELFACSWSISWHSSAPRPVIKLKLNSTAR